MVFWQWENCNGMLNLFGLISSIPLLLLCMPCCTACVMTRTTQTPKSSLDSQRVSKEQVVAKMHKAHHNPACHYACLDFVPLIRLAMCILLWCVVAVVVTVVDGRRMLHCRMLHCRMLHCRMLHSRMLHCRMLHCRMCRLCVSRVPQAVEYTALISGPYVPKREDIAQHLTREPML